MAEGPGPPAASAAAVPQPTASNWQYQALFGNSYDIITALAANRLAGILAGHLKAQGIIGQSVFEQATNYAVGVSEYTRVEHLITAVLTKTKCNPQCYHDFIEVLELDGIHPDTEAARSCLPTAAMPPTASATTGSSGRKGDTMAGAKNAVIFYPNTTYYRSHFALKTIIQLLCEQDEPSSRNFRLDFGPVWSDICEMLRWYGAHQVDRLWAVPNTLIEVRFASDKSLKKFLQSKRKVETAMAEIITNRFHATKPQDPSTTFKASTVLLLVTPNDATGTTEFRPVTLANHRNCISLYIKSKMAELPTEPKSALKTVPEDVLVQNDLPELMKLLPDFVDWYGLGLVLGIRYSKLRMIESDLSGAQEGRTLRLLSYVLVEWMQNHQEATWSTLVHALSSIGNRSAARKIAQEYGIHVPDESVLDDLSPQENEKLQQILEEIKQLINSKSSDMQLLKIQNAIEEAQRKKQITFKTFSSVLKGTISTVKTLLTQKENLEKQILQKENQLQQLREGQGAREIKTPDTRASALKQEVSELKQQLLETDQKLNTAKVQHRNDLLKKSAEIFTLSKQTHQLMTEKDTLVADLGSKIRSLETSLTKFSANQQHNLDMALQQQQRSLLQQQQLASQLQQQEEQHKRDIAALQEELHEQHSRSPEALKCLSDDALKQLAGLSLGANADTALYYMSEKGPTLTTMAAVTYPPDQVLIIMNREKPGELAMPCLGRPFQLGMLYDCRSDQLVSSVVLWNQETLMQLQALESKPQIFSSFDVIANNRTAAKLLKLGVDENLKLSFLAGLVNVSGAAAYLNDQTSSENQVRISLRYQSTAWIEHLSIEKLSDLDNPDIFKDTTATHFVSGVLYGADAVFVFDQEVSDNKEVHNTQRFMKAMVEKLPTVGNATLDISDTDKRKVQKFQCKVHCDLPLPEIPSTFKGAVKLCEDLPKLLGKSDPPKIVWLCPLSKLNSKVAPIAQEISAGIVTQTQDFMEAMHELKMKTSDLMSSEVCTSFVAIKEQLSCFKRRIAEYKVHFANKLAILIPKIRGGVEEETELNKLFTEKDASPFSHECLSSWVKGKVSEVKVLRNYLNHMEGFEFAFLPGDMDSVVNDPDFNLVISFTFTAVGQRDPYLERMTAYLQPHATGQDVINPPTPWQNNPKIINNMKVQTRLFESFAKANEQAKETKFVVTSSSDELSEEGAVIELYEDCNKELFEPPSQPGKPSATGVTHSSIQVNWSKPKYGSQNIQCYSVFYHDLSILTIQWKAEQTSSAKDSITVKDLSPQKKYCFKVQAVCKAGFSEVSEVSEPIQTDLVSVAPGKPIVSNKSHNSIQLQWSKAQYGEHNADFYTISCHETKDSPELESKKVKTEGAKQSATVSDLDPQTAYCFKVHAEFRNAASLVSDISDPIQTYPVPVPPGKPIASKVTHNSIQLEWPEAQYGGHTIDFYTVCYHEQIDQPAVELEYWKQTKTTDHHAVILISNLAAQTAYSFKVRAEFSGGVSLVSETSAPLQTHPAPVPPGKPIASNVTHNSVHLEWSKPQYKEKKVDCYTVLYHKIEDPPNQEQTWEEVKTDPIHKESVTVSCLAPHRKYSFKVCAQFENGMDLDSNSSDPVQTYTISVPPGKPIASNVTDNSVQLEWSKPQYKEEKVDGYTVLYHEIEDSPNQEQTWKEVKMGPIHEQSVTVSNLAPQKKYSFKVCAQFKSGIDLCSDSSDSVQTYTVPVPPGKPIASNVTHNSVQLKWSKPQYKEEKVDCYTVFYREIKDAQNQEQTWKALKMDPIHKESITIVNLAPHRMYSFKVYAKFERGMDFDSNSSDSVQTYTVPVPPGKPIASNVTHNSVQLEWSKPQYKEEKIDCYTVFYHEIEDPPNQEQTWKEVKMVPIHEQSVTVSSLVPHRKYFFKVCAKFESGMDLDSNNSDHVQTYPVPVPPGKPTASNVTHNSVWLKWSKAQCAGQNAEFYTISYHETLDSKPKWKESKTRCATECTLLSNLAAQTQYSIKVQAKFKTGMSLVGEISDSIQTYTVPVPPGKPTASNVTHNSVQLEWSEPNYGGQSVESYTVLYRDFCDIAAQRDWRKSCLDSPKQPATIENLASRTWYIFKVQAQFKTVSIYGESGEPIYTHSSPVPPGIPTAVNNTDSSIQLKWSKAQYGQNVMFYSIFYREIKDPSGHWKEIKATEEVITIDNLTPKTDYSFKVRATFEAGVQTDSEISVPIQTASPPVPPGKPFASSRTHNSVQLEWKKPHHEKQYFNYYSVFYSKEPGTWKEVQVQHNTLQPSVLVPDLTPETEYYFKVYAVFSSDSLESEISDSICTHPASVTPGKPYPYSVTHNSIELWWPRPDYGAEYVKSYTVLYNEMKSLLTDHEWKERKSRSADESITIIGLSAEKEYCFKIRAELKSYDLASGTSETSEPIKTKDRIALQMLSKKPTKEGPLEFHNLSMVEQMSDERNRIRKCFIGEYCLCIPSQQKVLLVVGATGAGKSTLINGMINYILKVEWEDTFRFKLITEKQQTQSKSQTKWITAYTLPKMDGSPVPYTLTVIDTPGFGDTGGLIRDREITQQIKEFFSKSCDDDGIDHINGIGFVTQSALKRLTPTQKYIFDAILSIFGKDVADNIFMMVTFADGKTPPVMAAINDAGFPYHNSYKFNNSALFASNNVDEVDDEDPEADNFDKMFWKMGTVSFKKFFSDFHKAKPASLQLTREVLEERERLETTVSGLQPQIRRGLAKIEEMRQEEEVLRHYEAEIAANKDFTYVVEIPKLRRVDLRGNVINCLRCNYICHPNCTIGKDEDKYKCSAMDRHGFCTVCTKKCRWDHHVINPYRYEEYMEKEERILDDLKKKYFQAVAGKTEKESMMTSIDHQLQECHTEVLTMIKEVQRCLCRLDEIALKLNPLTEVDFLDLLIESEKQQAEPGWLHRVKYLESAKQQAVILQRLKATEVVAEMDTGHEQKSGEEPWYAYVVWYARFKYWAGLS